MRNSGRIGMCVINLTAVGISTAQPLQEQAPSHRRPATSFNATSLVSWVQALRLQVQLQKNPLHAMLCCSTACASTACVNTKQQCLCMIFSAIMPYREGSQLQSSIQKAVLSSCSN